MNQTRTVLATGQNTEGPTEMAVKEWNYELTIKGTSGIVARGQLWVNVGSHDRLREELIRLVKAQKTGPTGDLARWRLTLRKPGLQTVTPVVVSVDAEGKTVIGR